MKQMTLLILMGSMIATANADTFTPSTSAGASGVRFAIGYTAGTHEGTAALVGSADIDPVTLAVAHAKFNVPILSLESGNAKRNCHIQESLGLDYEASDYPENHVCGSSNLLPAEGKNAVLFPEIKFEYASLGSGTVRGTFELHGVKREIEAPLTLSRGADGKIRVQSEFTVKLADHGVIVKPFLFVTVADTAKVVLDVLLEAVSEAPASPAL